MTPLLTERGRDGSSAEVIDCDPPAVRRPARDHLSTETRGLSTARAVLKVLTFMAHHPEGVSAREVARELGKSVSTAYDLLASLFEEGFACHEPGRGYRLSPQAAIGTRLTEPSHTRTLSRAVDELFDRTRRRSYLGRVEAGAIVVTAVCGRQGIPRVPGLEPRITANAHALALGKVVLSLLPEHSRRRYIERGLRRYTPRTITSPAALMSELDHARGNGFALDRGEFDVEYCCVAAPILDPRGRFLAVLGLSTLSRTFEAEVETLVATVRQVAAAASGGVAPTGSRDELRAADVRSRRAA